MSEELADRHCEPCEGGVPPLTKAQSKKLMEALHEDWVLNDDADEISRTFSFKAYSHTIAFANTVAWIATNEGHHPDMRVSYGECHVQFSTHAIDGLSDNDFICAAKIDRCAGAVLN